MRFHLQAMAWVCSSCCDPAMALTCSCSNSDVGFLPIHSLATMLKDLSALERTNQFTGLTGRKPLLLVCPPTFRIHVSWGFTISKDNRVDRRTGLALLLMILVSQKAYAGEVYIASRTLDEGVLVLNLPEQVVVNHRTLWESGSRLIIPSFLVSDVALFL